MGAKSMYHAFMMKAFSGFIMAGMLFTISLIIGIVSSKDFSEDVWNSKYFN